MDNLQTMADGLRELLDAKNHAREEALRISRETIRLSANSIRATHREEFDEAQRLKSQARAKVEETKALLKDQLEIYYTGYVQDAQKEYAESELTYALAREQNLPTNAELGVDAAVYLNGLAEAIGEMRRHVLDILRKGDLDRGERILEIMDDVYYVLITFDYPDAVTMGLRRQTDMVRGVLERTRADITLLRQQQKLEGAIGNAISRLSGE